MLTEQEQKALTSDPDGLTTYEYIANHIEDLNAEDIEKLASNMIAVDSTGQFTASAARYLTAINPASHHEAIKRLVAATIDKDREHRYIADLLPSIWGRDYEQHAEELKATDNNFRRIYKRLFPTSTI